MVSIPLVIYFIIVIIPNLADVAQASTDTQLPIILIHGYSQDRSVWNQWVHWLREDNFSNIFPIRFQNDDKCGSAEEHAQELSGIVETIVANTGHEQVNIVGHSKGGLDARTYIATGTSRVANLVMVGTPNSGTAAALWDFTGCFPVGINELLPGSPGTIAEDHPENTNYYTIAGNWIPNQLCPAFFVLIEDGGNCFIPGDDDGLVPVESVKSSPDYTALGDETPHHHLDLLNHRAEYEMALTVLDDFP
jgi:pimeloyl-ACP methyl ester carboxylesterase